MAEEDAQFDYKPGKGSLVTPKNHHSVTWTASEYIEHSRGASWYLSLIVGSVALAAGTYFLLHDIFASIFILMLGVIVGTAARRKPQQVTYELNNDGLNAGNKGYPYSQFRSFAIVREGQLNSLVLIPLKRLMPPISAYFDETDEEKITTMIGEHLPLEERAPDKIDRLTRRLRF